MGSNLTFDADGNINPGLNAQLFEAHPLAGRWHLVVVVQNPVSGAEISQRFTGRVTFNRLQTHATGLPNSSDRVLKAGKPVTATVYIRNTGVQPLAVGADPRLNKVQTLQPVPVFGSTSFDLPDTGNAPAYILPPDTSRFTVAASSTVPAQVEIQEGSSAGVDLSGDLQAAKAGSTVSVVSIGEPRGSITRGLWFASVNEVGPFSDAGAPAGETTVTAAMRTAGFDPAVTSSTDDPYRISVDPTSDGFGTPVLIQPGQVGAIQITITPQGKKGSVVSGHLNLVTPPLLPTGPTALPQVTSGSVISTPSVQLQDRLALRTPTAAPMRSRAGGPLACRAPRSWYLSLSPLRAGAVEPTLARCPLRLSGFTSALCHPGRRPRDPSAGCRPHAHLVGGRPGCPTRSTESRPTSCWSTPSWCCCRWPRCWRSSARCGRPPGAGWAS